MRAFFCFARLIEGTGPVIDGEVNGAQEAGEKQQKLQGDEAWICYIFLNSFQRDNPASLNSTGLM